MGNENLNFALARIAYQNNAEVERSHQIYGENVQVFYRTLTNAQLQIWAKICDCLKNMLDSRETFFYEAGANDVFDIIKALNEEVSE
jgi:hypothetical protein